MRKLAYGVAISLLFSTAARAQTQFGIYSGAAHYGVKGVSKFVAWFGHPLDRVIDFAPFNSWADVVSGGNADAYAWFLASPLNANGKRTLVPLTLSVPLVATGSTIAQVASGADNTYFTQLAADLIHLGYSNAYIRLGWEFSGGWYPWAASKDLKNWVSAFQHAVDGLRAAAGQKFTIIWCYANGNAPEKLETLYPGDSYVDIIADDVYDTNWSVPAPSPQLRWQALLQGRTQYGDYGLSWLAAFGALHQKRVAIPEWGTGNYTPLNRGVNPGGGDDPSYINNMAAWIKANNVAFSSYFNYASANYQTTIDTGLFPHAGTALKGDYNSLTTTR